MDKASKSANRQMRIAEVGNLLPLSLAPAVGRALGRQVDPKRIQIFSSECPAAGLFATGNLLQTLMQVRLPRFLSRQIRRVWVSGLAGLDLPKELPTATANGSDDSK